MTYLWLSFCSSLLSRLLIVSKHLYLGSGMNFYMHCYKTTTPSAGMPVAFSVQVEDKSYYMCCEEEHGKMIVRFRVRICFSYPMCMWVVGNIKHWNIRELTQNSSSLVLGLTPFPFFLRKEKFPKTFLVKATSSSSKRHLHLTAPRHLSLNTH